MSSEEDNRPPGAYLPDLRRMRAFPHEYSDEDRRRVHRKTGRGWWMMLVFVLFGVVIAASWWYWIIVLLIVGLQSYMQILANDIVGGVPHPGGTRHEETAEQVVHEPSISQELARFVDMYEAGHLTRAEFEAAKAKLLGER